MPIRKHQGIVQTGGKAGKLKKGYKYSGKKLKRGLPQIVKVKKNKKIGGKPIASGSYGCLFDPAIRCPNEEKNDDFYNNKISKVSLDNWANDKSWVKKEGLEEEKISAKLKKLDNEGRFFFGVEKICEIIPNQVQDILTKNPRGICNRLKNRDNNPHHNMIMRKADLDMAKVFANKSPYFNVTIDTIAKTILKTCISCEKLKSIGIAAFDIKGDNMMFMKPSDNEMESVMIDFGTAFMPTNFNELQNKIQNRHIIYTWAPEIWLFDPLQDQTILTKQRQQLEFDEWSEGRNLYSWFRKYYMKAFKNNPDGTKNTQGWRDYIDKAMVFQIVYSIFYWGSSPDFYNDYDEWGGGGGFLIPSRINAPFSDIVEKALKSDKRGKNLRKIMRQMMTINPEQRPNLKQVKNQIMEVMNYTDENQLSFEIITLLPRAVQVPQQNKLQSGIRATLKTITNNAVNIAQNKKKQRPPRAPPRKKKPSISFTPVSDLPDKQRDIGNIGKVPKKNKKKTTTS